MIAAYWLPITRRYYAPTAHDQPSRRAQRTAAARSARHRAAPATARALAIASAARPATPAQIRAVTDPESPVQVRLRRDIVRATLRTLHAQARAARVHYVTRAEAMLSYPGPRHADPQSWVQKLANSNREYAWQAHLQARAIQEAGLRPASVLDAIDQAEADAATEQRLGVLGDALTHVCRQLAYEEAAEGGSPGASYSTPGTGPRITPPGGGPSTVSASTPSVSIATESAAGLGSAAQEYARTYGAPSSHGITASYSTTAAGDAGGGGDTGRYDDDALGSWLSRAIDRNKKTLTKVLGPASAAAGFIPVLGPVLSTAINAVSTAIGAREDRKAREAEARILAAQGVLNSQLPTAPPPSTPPTPPARARAATMRSPDWILPAALIGGALILTRK